jgi:hypothetical protein
MIISPEVLKIIQSKDLLLSFTGILYIFSFISFKKFNPYYILISTFTVLLLVFNNKPFLFINIISFISLIQALLFLRNDKKRISFKYFIYTYLLLLLNLPIFAQIQGLLLAIILLCKILFSDKDEINNMFVFITNTTILYAASFFLMYTQTFNQLLSLTIYYFTALAILRFILDKSLKEPIFILPFFIISSISISYFYCFGIFLYLFIATHTIKKPFHMFLFIVPFIDSSIFHHVFSEIINSLNSNHSLYFSIALIFLLLFAVLKYLEKCLLKTIELCSYKVYLLIILPLIILYLPLLLNLEFNIIKPIPLFLAIPMLVIDAIYINLVQKISMERIYSFIIKNIKTLVKTISHQLKILYIFSIKIFLYFVKILKKLLLKCFYLIYFLTIKNSSKSYKLTKKYIILPLSKLVEQTDTIISNKINLEHLVTILTLFILSLIYLLGDI